MSGKPTWREIDASANESLTRFHTRTGWEPACVDMPFDDMILAEDDGEDGKPGEYEMRQRMIGIKGMFRFLKARGVHPADMLKQLAAAGRACHEAPFDAMTMGEVGMLFGQDKAAHSWRCKIVSREIELSGMKGSKLPGQKSREASENYREARMGNTNRRDGKNNGNGRRKA